MPQNKTPHDYFMEGYQNGLGADQHDSLQQGKRLGVEQQDLLWSDAIIEIYGEEFLAAVKRRLRSLREEQSRA